MKRLEDVRPGIVMVEVLGTDEFEQWFLALSEKEAEAIARVVGLLEEKGVALGFPYSSELKGHRLYGSLGFNREDMCCVCSTHSIPFAEPCS